MDFDRIGIITLKVLGGALILALMTLFMMGGTPYSRLLYPAALAIGLINPVWALYAMALYGPLFLIDPGNTHLLVGIEVFILGAAGGELRQLGRTRDLSLSATPGQRDFDSVLKDQTQAPVNFGLWPCVLASMLLMLAASSIFGIRLLMHREDAIGASPNEFLTTLNRMYYGWATYPEFTLRSLHNWIAGGLIAIIAARRATPLRAARWLKCGAIGLVAACLLSLLDRVGMANLDAFRRANPDPLHLGRLQGTAGHAGWFALWIVLTWPGLILWWSNKGRIRRIGVAVALIGIVAPALVLTAARASWLGAGAALALGVVWLWRSEPAARRWIVGGLAAIAATGLLLLFASDVVGQRVATLLRFSDRANYWTSTFLFVSLWPTGIGLGTHATIYESWIPWFNEFHQPDHVTAHSIFLHPLAENGYIFLALMFGALGMVARDVARAGRVVSAGTKRILFALSAGAGGLFIAGIAQDVIYIRMVEVGLWIALGLLVGIARREAPQLFAPLDRHHAKLFLGSFVAGAALTGAVNLARHVEGAWPRAFDSDTNAGMAYWLNKEFRLAVDPYVTRIEFSASRVHGKGDIDVRWPDGSHDYAILEAGDSGSKARHPAGRFFAREFNPPAPGEGGEPRWLTIKVTGDSFVPAHLDPASTDHRELTVYISDLWIYKAGDGPRPAL